MVTPPRPAYIPADVDFDELSQSSEIYQRFVDFCPPYQLPEPWRILDASCVAVTRPLNLQDVVNSLIGEFGQDAVLESGLASRTEAGLVGAEILTTCDGIFVLIYDQAGTKINDLITSKGCLSGHPVPVIPAWDDKEVVEDLGCQTSSVYIVTTLPEFVIFLALGMPATFYYGAETHPHGYGLISQWTESKSTPRRRPGAADRSLPYEPETELTPNSDYPHLNDPNCELILVAVDLINFVSSQSTRFEHLETLLTTHTNQFQIDAYSWSPSGDELERFQSTLKSMSPRNLRNWILDSCESSIRRLDDGENRLAAPPRPVNLSVMLDLVYGGASERLNLSETDTGDEVHQHLDRLIYQQLSRPLLADAERLMDPALANIQTQFAALSHICFSQAASLLVKGRQSRRVAVETFAVATEKLLPMMKMCLTQYQTIRSTERSRNRTPANRRRLSD